MPMNRNHSPDLAGFLVIAALSYLLLRILPALVGLG